MKKIGITGNIGCGKSWICALFEAQGIPVFYSDYEAKQLYNREEIKTIMTARFGKEIYFPDGNLDKKQLSELIFNDKESRSFVEQTLYPALNQYFKEWAERQQAPYVLYESAIIFEKHIEDLFDAVIMVSASETTRLRRVVTRDHCTPEEALIRMKAQWPESEKQNLADFIIYHENDDEDDDLLRQIAVIDEALKSI